MEDAAAGLGGIRGGLALSEARVGRAGRICTHGCFTRPGACLDSGYVLARFGCSVGTGDADCDAADANADGAVDPLDVGFVLARFGDCP